MDLCLSEKVYIVTGGSSGIGAAIVQALADEGAVPLNLDLNAPDKGMTRSETFFQLDLCDEESLAAAFREILHRWGRIDGVVNNAGVNDSVGLGASLEEFESSLRKNLVQCFSLVKQAREAICRSQGAIVNIGSKVYCTGQGGTSGYAAAKGGLAALTREWALEMAGHGVRCNAVIPAEVWTPMYDWFLQKDKDPVGRRREIESRIPLGARMTTPEEIAAMAVFLLSPRSSHTTGQIIFVDGGYTHLDRAYRPVL